MDVVFSFVSTCEVSGDMSSRGICANCVSSQLRGNTFAEVYFWKHKQQGTKARKQTKNRYKGHGLLGKLQPVAPFVPFQTVFRSLPVTHLKYIVQHS